MSKDRWLNDMPHKAIIWHSLYDTLRGFSDDTAIAIELEARLERLVHAVETLKDEPASMLAKYREALAWLRERL